MKRFGCELKDCCRGCEETGGFRSGAFRRKAQRRAGLRRLPPSAILRLTPKERTAAQRPHLTGRKHECRADPLDLAALLCGSCAASTCHARRHWNSTSYRTAAGSYFSDFLYPNSPHWRISPHGAEGDRTPDLCSAIAALSQLSYSPATMRDRPYSLSGRAMYPSHTGHNIKAPLKDSGPSIPSQDTPKPPEVKRNRLETAT